MVYISATYFFHIVKIVEDFGVNRAELSAVLDIDLTTKVHPKTKYSLDQFDKLITFSQQFLDDPYMGLHISEAFRISTFPGPSQILAFSNTIEDAASLSIRYAGLVHTLGLPRMVKGGDPGNSSAYCIWIPNYDDEKGTRYRQITEYVVSNYVMSLNWLAWGFGKGIKKVSFAHDCSSSPDEFVRVYGCGVEFGARQHKVELYDGIVDKPMPTADPSQLALLKPKLERILASQRSEDDIVIRVEGEIRKLLSTSTVSLPGIAEMFELNERTLRRKLNAEGTNFAAILANVRKNMCNIYMAEGRALSEVAQLLGYSEQSAFTRAYKKWYGVSPKHHEE